MAEAFWSTLKIELVHRHTWPTRAMARQAVFEWIESFYNLRRLHSSLGYRTPATYEAAVTCALKSHADLVLLTLAIPLAANRNLAT